VAAPARGAHAAVVTWDISAQGPLPVARNHAELISAGLAVQLEGRLAQHARIHAALTMSSFAALAAELVPWLLVGGTLVLHHPFDPDAFKAQAQANPCDTVVVPGPVVPQLAQAGLLTAQDGLEQVLGVWRAPERLVRAAGWHDRAIAMVDIQVFGETGLIAATRGADGRPAAIAVGPQRAPRAGKTGIVVSEVATSPGGTLALRGTMVPICPFPPGAERGDLPFVKVGADGFADTGYPCRPGPDGTLGVSAPPPGLVGVGGYRFVMHELQDQAASTGGTLAVLPDALMGARLAGTARHHLAAREALTALGSNPLLTNAFRGTSTLLTGR
jgi:hypothetical protein